MMMTDKREVTIVDVTLVMSHTWKKHPMLILKSHDDQVDIEVRLEMIPYLEKELAAIKEHLRQDADIKKAVKSVGVVTAPAEKLMTTALDAVDAALND